MNYPSTGSFRYGGFKGSKSLLSLLLLLIFDKEFWSIQIFFIGESIKCSNNNSHKMPHKDNFYWVNNKYVCLGTQPRRAAIGVHYENIVLNNLECSLLRNIIMKIIFRIENCVMHWARPEETCYLREAYKFCKLKTFTIRCDLFTTKIAQQKIWFNYYVRKFVFVKLSFIWNGAISWKIKLWHILFFYWILLFLCIQEMNYCLILWSHIFDIAL